jgi:hypothetical protein
VYDSVVRKVTRDIDEDVRDRVRALANTEAFQQSRRERKKIEMRFAHMKRIFRLDRLRLRGLSGARDEVLLTATAQNLRRLVKFPATAIGGARRPVPHSWRVRRRWRRCRGSQWGQRNKVAPSANTPEFCNTIGARYRHRADTSACR